MLCVESVEGESSLHSSTTLFITYLPSQGMGRSNKESGGGMEGAFPFY